MRRFRLVLLIGLIGLIGLILVGSVFGGADPTPRCRSGEICVVLMYGRTDASARLDVKCWNENGFGNVTLQQVGGNDWFVRCE